MPRSNWTISNDGSRIDKEVKGTSNITSSNSSKLLVRCDPTKVSQVVFNLIDNAMKFTKQGTITITYRKEAAERSPSPSS